MPADHQSSGRPIEFEETKVWPGLRQALSGAQTQELGEKLQKAEDHATVGGARLRCPGRVGLAGLLDLRGPDGHGGPAGCGRRIPLVVRDAAPADGGAGFPRDAGHNLGDAGVEVQQVSAAFIPAADVGAIALWHEVGLGGECLDAGAQFSQFGDVSGELGRGTVARGLLARLRVPVRGERDHVRAAWRLVLTGGVIAHTCQSICANIYYSGIGR
jgi:hypothetical protein